MRHEDVGRRQQGSSGTPGGLRGNALWGGKGTRLPLLLAALLVLAVALGAGRADHAQAAKDSAYVPEALLAAAKADPDAVFEVIVQGRGRSSRDLADDIRSARKDLPGRGFGVRRRFTSLAGTSAELTGRQLVRLASRRGILAITADTKTAGTAYSNSQLWPAAAGAKNWSTPPANTTYPTIAIVDSGVQPGRTEFGSRLLAQVNFVSAGANSPGDGRGHGTLVASIAANGGSSYTGAEPRANLVSLDVLDDSGNGRVSDVLAACDWILAHKAEYNIRVANLSLNAGGAAFYADPLDHAVETLWLSGIVVVVASGNYGTTSGPSGVVYSPANDPFVVTVGASGTGWTTSTRDDYAAPWSAWGPTNEGFLKPELAAPGRWMRGAVPSDSTMKDDFADRSLGSDYMWMSGTSFAAPVVSGVAATILSRHPSWTPDQVKGALMLSASVPDGYSSDGALGVGVVNGTNAMATSGAANPNAGLNQFVSTDPATGLPTFDGWEWQSEASSNASWNSASWSSASWSSASWSSASWSSASWSSASWSSASWSSNVGAQASWANNAASEEDESG
jgi:serine protease AprX